MNKNKDSNIMETSEWSKWNYNQPKKKQSEENKLKWGEEIEAYQS